MKRYRGRGNSRGRKIGIPEKDGDRHERLPTIKIKKDEYRAENWKEQERK